MRIALISDIHGNLMALERVLTELEQENIDQIVCLGDVAIFGPQPCETVARVRALGCPTVMGNTDAWALNPQPHPVRDENTPKFNEIELWGAAQLGAADRDCIRTFQPIIEIDVAGDVRLLCYHGSPRSFHDPIHVTTPDEEVAPMVAGVEATLLAGGHTHVQMVRRYGEKVIINPGSVGLPFEQLANGAARNPPWAEYALLTWEAGRLSIDLRRTRVDVAEIRRSVEVSGMPHAEWWLEDWK